MTKRAEKFFTLSANWKASWVDALNDAPGWYNPNFLELIENDELRDGLQDLLDALIEEAEEEGKPVGPLRNLLLRRVVWLARVCERMEYRMEELADSSDPADKALLDQCCDWYAQQTSAMLDVMFYLAPPNYRSTKRKNRKERRRRTGVYVKSDV